MKAQRQVHVTELRSRHLWVRLLDTGCPSSAAPNVDRITSIIAEFKEGVLNALQFRKMFLDGNCMTWMGFKRAAWLTYECVRKRFRESQERGL